MGYQRRVHGESEWRSVIMKFLLVLSLVAATQAEADPAFAYGFGGHFLPYAVHHAPIVHTPVVYTHHTGYSHYAHYAPLAYSGHHYGYYGLGHPLGYYGKRSAEPEAEAAPEAEAEADPWLLYGLGYGGHVYGGHYGYGYHHALPYYYLGGCRNYLGAAVPCA